MSNWMTSFCSANNSGALSLVAQDSLLKHFLKKSTYEVRTSAGHDLNYVIFRRSKQYPTAHLRKPGEKEKTLILMHGFGLGLGFFYDNYDALTSYYDKVIAVDWVGMGASSRTSTRITRLSLIESLTKCATKEEHEKEVAKRVTDEFIDSLEDLRKEEKIENFVLAGHSLGGYLVGKYAIKYPKEVKGLILISPVGIPEQPSKEDRVDPATIDWRINFMKKLWNLNITPQALIRVIGSRGPGLVENFIGRRFANRWQGEELKLISDYFYHITAAPGNGEYALNALLEPIFVKNQAKSNRSPTEGKKGEEEDDDKLNEQRKGGFRTGVFAKNPLENELSHVKFPILLIYGDHDWLYYPGARNSIDLWKKSGINAELSIIANAGHHLYLDNSEDFNQLLIEWTKKNKS